MLKIFFYKGCIESLQAEILSLVGAILGPHVTGIFSDTENIAALAKNIN